MLFKIKMLRLMQISDLSNPTSLRQSIGFVASGPGPRKVARLVKNPSYATPTYASLIVVVFSKGCDPIGLPSSLLTNNSISLVRHD